MSTYNLNNIGPTGQQIETTKSPGDFKLDEALRGADLARWSIKEYGLEGAIERWNRNAANRNARQYACDARLSHWSGFYMQLLSEACKIDNDA